MVWYSPEIDASKFTLHILWDTPGGFYWLRNIVLTLYNATHRLGDGKRVIFWQRVQGSVRAIRAVWNTRVFLTETRVDADVHCVFSSMYLYICVSMYLYSYPSTHGLSGLTAGSSWEQFVMHLKMMMMWTQICIWRPWESEFGGHDHVNWETVIECFLRCHWEAIIMPTWRLEKREFGYTHGGHDWLSWVMYYEAVIKRV